MTPASEPPMKTSARNHPLFHEIALASAARDAGQHHAASDHMIYAVLAALRLDRDAASRLAAKMETRILERMLTVKEPKR
jgi:hypothetical protein